MNTGMVVLSLVLSQAGPGGDQYGEEPPANATPRVLRDAPPPRTPRDEAAPSSTRDSSPAASERPAPPRQTGGAHAVTIYSDDDGHKLQVDGQDFFVFGMNWGYVPVGTNYNYSLWNQPDAFIRNALDYEMKLLKDMGVNTVRQYTGIPKRWIEYIHDKYGIYTMLNHAMGRYGFEINGVYRAPTNYQDERTRAAIKEDIYALVENYKDTRGLLFWLLGNENNYGLEWSSNEIEDLPLDQRNAGKAEYLYTLYGEIVDGIHERDRKHPVAIANGDLQYIDLIAKHVPNLDIMGSNVYRGYSSRDLFQDVQNQLGVPFVYTEFGADAYNARENREDHIGQAEYFRTLWQEIYEQSYGKGRVGNAIGGYSFQWSDGWWKYRQEINLDVHDTTASWRNEAYPHDLPVDGNNMNEEWFGICAKSRPDEQGYFRLFPRASYYVLRDGYTLDPYAADTSLEKIRRHWGSLKADEVAVPYEVQKLQDDVKELSLLRVSELRIELESYYTDGALLDVPGEREFSINFAPTTNQERQQKRVESLQSFYVGVATNPVRGVEAEAIFNILGNVPTNPINEIFYENRAFLDEGILNENDEPLDIPGLERTQVWAAKLTWDESWFNLEGFYRTGHYHWGYEGDFFGLRPSTYFGEAIDIYNADIPVGFEVTGKKGLEGFKLLFGQQVYWGANPLVMGKYQTQIGDYELAIIHQEDISQQQDAATSAVIPQPQTRKTTVYGARQYGPLKFEVGGIMAGSPLINEDIQTVEEAPNGAVSYLNSGFFVQDDEIRFIDTLGAKGKVTGTFGQVNAYVQGAYKGLVAGGGPDATLTFTGWSLKESGQGNHWNVLSGLTYLLGNVQIAPNFLFQKPLEEALPNVPGFVDEQTGQFFPGVAPRNIVDDPFAVRGNQELAAYELLIVWDPTPATFFWQFDNRAQEDSPLALGLDLIYRDYRGVQDAGIGVLGDGTQFPFDTSVPEEDLFEASIQARGVINGVRYVALLYGGEGQPNGDDERVVQRYGLNYEVSYKRLFVNGFIRIDDWGPYDFQRDFNLTFPLQTMLDVSYGAVLPRWMYEGYTRFGVRTQWRLLNDFSPRFRVDESNPTQDRLFSNLGDGDNLGYELEVLTYINITL